jgi:Concanavalin A-like lectin/glucanases superfamily
MTPQPPTVAAAAASGVTTTGATVNGSVNPNGQDTTYYFQYGRDTSYGQSTATVDAGSGASAVAVSANLSALAQGTTYHVQLVATNATSTTYGPDTTFATQQPPTVSTGQVTGVTPGSATLSGTLNPQGQKTSYYFEYGTTSSYGQTTPTQVAGSGSSPVGVTANLTSLAPNTPYHAQLVATSSAGTVSGGDVTFTTLAPPPYAQTIRADGPVSYWRFDEASGTKAADQIGVNSGTYSGRYALGVPGAIAGDAAVALNGSSGYVSVPDSASLHTGNTFTIEAWVKLASLGLNHGIAGKGTYAFYVNTSNRLVLTLSNVGVIATATSAIADTTHWHYVVATKSGAAAHLYLDGADVTGPVTNRTITNASVPLRIGSAVGWLDGAIDEVAIYAKALTAAQVHSHYVAAGSH